MWWEVVALRNCSPYSWWAVADVLSLNLLLAFSCSLKIIPESPQPPCLPGGEIAIDLWAVPIYFKNTGKRRRSPGRLIRVFKASALWFSLSLNDFMCHSSVTVFPWAFLRLVKGLEGGTRDMSLECGMTRCQFGWKCSQAALQKC